jgi:Na+/proline symporter
VNNWILTAILVGPIIYIGVTLTAKSPVSIAEYEYGDRRLNPSDVLDSSIMYALQVAAIALFATWGHMYGFAAAAVPLFWMLGYIIFSWMLSDSFLQRFASDKSFRTLHDFLADRGTSRPVCVVAALLTLFGLAGPAMFEAFTVGRTIVAAAPNLGSSGGAGLALGFLAVALIYMIRGGFSGVVKLEQLQLAIGYGGFNVAFAGALYLNSDRIGNRQAILLAVICLICTVIFSIAKLWYHLKVRTYLANFPANQAAGQTRDVLGWIACLLGMASFLAVLIWLPQTEGIASKLATESGLPIHINFGFTALALLSLFVANAFYQFVDVTQWQRLLSIRPNTENLAETGKILRSNILIGGICSSLTWVIAVAFGVFLKYLYPDQDPYSVFSHFAGEVAKSQAKASAWLLFVFIAALIAVMFSTLDSLVAGTSFTVQNDILSGYWKSNSPGAVALSRISTVLVVLLQLAFYLIVSEVSGERVDAVLYVCWSFQLAMLPVVFSMLLGRGGTGWSRVAAMIAGAIAASLPLILNVADRTYEISPWLTVMASGTVLVVLGGFKRPRESYI